MLGIITRFCGASSHCMGSINSVCISHVQSWFLLSPSHFFVLVIILWLCYFLPMDRFAWNQLDWSVDWLCIGFEVICVMWWYFCNWIINCSYVVDHLSFSFISEKHESLCCGNFAGNLGFHARNSVWIWMWFVYRLFYVWQVHTEYTTAVYCRNVVCVFPQVSNAQQWQQVAG